MLESSLENANDAILITEAEPVDLPGPRIIYANKAFLRTTGYTAEEVLGQTPRILQGPRTDPQARATIRRALERWRPVCIEVLNYRKDGSEFWVELNIMPVANEKGWFTHWVSVQRDTTARKATQAQMEEQVRLAALGAQIGLTLTGPDHLSDVLHHCAESMVTHLGAAFARIWTLNEATEVLELQASAGLYTHLDGPHSRVPVGQFKIGLIAQERRPHLTNAVIGDPRVGDQAWAKANGMVAFAGYPLIVEDRLTGVVALFSREPLSEPAFQALQSISNAIALGIQHRQAQTELKQGEEALREAKHKAEEAQAEAERANLAKSEFLSRMSHELRTPLNAILGFGQLLEMDATSDGQRAKLAHILKGGNHLLGLINEVLDIARIESGQIDLTLETIKVAEVCDEAAELIQPLAAQRNIRISHCTGSARGGAVRADRQRLRQVVLNLLSNAVKYNRAGGTVALSCVPAARAGVLHLAVTDTGPGISPAGLRKLFTPFERLGAEQSSVEGTGIGLALSKSLVEAMGGSIGVDSSEGHGSTFYLELPSAESHPPAAELPVAAVREMPSETASTVLYVEDNQSNYALVELALESQRPAIRLLGATLGRQGLALARERRPQLILLDMGLPDLGGEEILQQLQADALTRAIPVVMVSADATEGQARRLLDLGARAYVTKPLKIGAFIRTIDEMLAGEAELASH